MKLKLLLITSAVLLSSTSMAAETKDACTQFYDAYQAFYEQLHQEGVPPEKTAEYRQDITMGRIRHAGFSESDKKINNDACQEELADIDSQQSLIRDLIKNF